jgi:hypothetical protein
VGAGGAADGAAGAGAAGAAAALDEGAGGAGASLAALGVAGGATLAVAVALGSAIASCFFDEPGLGAAPGASATGLPSAGSEGGDATVPVGAMASGGDGALGAGVAVSELGSERAYQAPAPPASATPTKARAKIAMSAPAESFFFGVNAGCEVAKAGTTKGACVLGIVVANEAGPGMAVPAGIPAPGCAPSGAVRPECGP